MKPITTEEELVKLIEAASKARRTTRTGCDTCHYMGNCLERESCTIGRLIYHALVLVKE
jgi:hypothetical protein